MPLRSGRWYDAAPLLLLRFMPCPFHCSACDIYTHPLVRFTTVCLCVLALGFCGCRAPAADVVVVVEYGASLLVTLLLTHDSRKVFACQWYFT